MKRYSVIFLIALLLTGCTEEQPQPESLVLEGWIDAGGHPVVLIHKSLVMADAPPNVRSIEEIVEDHLIPFGKVTVSDGEQEVILTGRLDTAYMPPYTYSSVYMDGQVGKTYTVTAKYRNLYATATTTIPSVVHLDSLDVWTDNLGRVSVSGYLSGQNNKDNYYAVFIRTEKQKQFHLCPMGVFDASIAVDGRIEIAVKNPDQDADNDIGYYFVKDSTNYQLKLAHIDYTAYQFWKAYNEQLLTSGILFVPVYKNIPGNVSGGIGNFSGLGSSTYTFTTARDTTYRYN